ncbi:MAG: hypothetical protein R3236_04110, partial [Phycisphaeraceae bacterium]|nr:hypothetical protein [Phycisphaeraceae bacterium]
LLLVLMHVAAWVAGLISVAMAAGLVDYLLRLPAWMRLLGLIIGAGAAVVSVAIRINQAWSIWPKLTTLALRLEKTMPGTSGSLASAVAFATQPSTVSGSPTTSALAERSMTRARSKVQPDQINALIDMHRVWASVGAMCLALALIGSIAAAAPQTFATASSRWLRPLGDAAWPLRNAVELDATGTVAPDNMPIRLTARVIKGDEPNLRAWVVYRFTMADGSVSEHRQLMTRVDDNGAYERRVEPRDGAVSLSYHVEAGDARSGSATVKLFPPPTLESLRAELIAPDYARPFVETETHRLLTPPRPLVALDALTGSRIRLIAEVQGAVDLRDNSEGAGLVDWVRRTLEGMPPKPKGLDYRLLKPIENRKRFEISWTHTQAVQFSFALQDPYGNRYEDQRKFRFDLRQDAPPRATVLVPTVDQSVLPTAVLKLEAEVQDDVAVASGRLVARRPRLEDPLVLARTDAVQKRAHFKHTFDLNPLKLTPGDELTVTAIARDNFNLGGKRHDPVVSAPRRIRIISQEQLMRELRIEMAKVRDRAVHARGTQQRLSKAPANSETAKKQQRVAQNIKNLARSLKQLDERIRTNRLSDEWLDETLGDSKRLSRSAQAWAQQAAGQLKQAAEKEAESPEARQQKKQLQQQAKDAQKRTGEDLQKLIDRLDQGRTAFQLTQKLSKIAKDQRDLSEQVRKTMPRTLGRPTDQLSPEDRKKLQEMAQKQGKLSEASRELIKQMLTTAAALQRQSKKPEDQATTEAIRKAAKLAQERKLDEQMKQAGKQAQQNRLSQAQSNQQQSLQTIKQMQRQLQQAEKIRKEILQRRLMELVEAIRLLKQQQEGQINRLLTAKRYEGLDTGLVQLRRRTQAISDKAAGTDRKAQPIAEALDAAADHQAQAVKELRLATVDAEKVEKSERRALAKITEALKLAEKLAQSQQDQQQQKKLMELIGEYLKVLAEQKQILTATKQARSVGPEQRDRKWRIAAVKLGDRQADVRVALSKLAAKLREAGSIVYLSVHEQMNGWSDRAAADLRRAEPSAATAFHQQMIVDAIESLVEALKRDPDDSQFNRPNNNGGGGGGGQGGQQPPRLIPPVAELKLLKQRQAMVHQMTRALGDKKVPAETRTLMLQELGRQQRQLFETGQKLIEQLERMRRLQGGATPKPGEDKP